MSNAPGRGICGRQFVVLTCALLLLAATLTAAQSVTANTDRSRPASPASVLTHDTEGRVIVRATRITQPMRIDGRLDEAAYQEVPAITEFIQQIPIEGASITEKTEAWVIFDDKNIYIACRCWDEHPDRIIANDMRRDTSNLSQQDHFSLVFDTFHDRRNGFMFYISAIGALRDAISTDEIPNFDWNGVWDGKARRFEGGWIAEMAFPFKSLRYKPGREQTWGIQLRRGLGRKNEFAYLTPVSPAWGTSAMQHMSEAATLVSLEAPATTLNLELKPYAMSSVTTDRVGTPAVRSDMDPDAGIDVKYGLTKGLTTDFTYNTDFAQVEADEAQVNLTRFSLSFPEKREFFLEGQGIFAFGGGRAAFGNDAPPAVFYSRRIGLSGAHVVPVLAGGRLTGKAGPWSIGALNMETDAVAGTVPTNFTVLRLRRDVMRRSNVGGIFTRRSVSTIAPGANQVIGLDGNLAFYRNIYLTGYLAQSRTNGLRGRDLAYDAQFNYTADRYGLALNRRAVEENFNPEVGLLQRQNFRRNFVQSRFSPRPKRSRLIRKWTSQASLEYITDNQNHLESRELRGEFSMDFENADSFFVQYLRLYDFLPVPFSISQGVRIPVGGYSFNNLQLSYTAGRQHRASLSTGFDIGNFYNGDKKATTLRGRVEVTSQLGIEPNVSLNWIELPQGRFTTKVVGGRATFTMTPRMFVAVLLQYGSSNTSLSTNLRFRWEYRPGSELFIVYTEGRSTLPPRRTDLESRGFVVKINRLLRF